jgi:hypothetical protein
MNHACPKCGVSLKWRRVPSRTVPEGTPFYRAKETTRFCPACRAPLMLNDNSRLGSIGMITFLAVMFYAGAVSLDRGGIWPVIAGAVLSVAWAAGLWYRWKYLRNWPVWTPNEGAR